MSTHKICLLGGTGFVGRRLAARLSESGHDIVILTRHRERRRELLVLPTVRLVQGDVHDSAFLRSQFEGRDVVINLVGILNEPGRDGRGFARAHTELPEKIVEACRQTGVTRLLHMSALHASPAAPSHYLRTKSLGEEAVLRAGGPDFHVTSFRPSVIFGPGDSFLNRFAGLLRMAPGLFPLACPEARFQPVYVEDVARAFVASLDNHHTFGNRYDLCGPRV
ncbi:MAG: complex I NDUFA9 subunit family protein, partial [Gammaproteobacteria bacterium]|nr:complex I NDUFA9 subunit family protein [Gammaproteobacteria bacterium]